MSIAKIETIPVRIRRQEAYLGAMPAGSTEQTYFVRQP